LPDRREDLELIAASAQGDRAAFSVLVRRHRAAVWRLARALTASEQAAEDVLQETFLAVYRGASGFRGEGSARSWILGTARLKAARTWRRRAGEPAAPEPLDELGCAAGWGDPELAVAALEDRDRLHAALWRLAPADREVLVLRDLEQLSGPEVARATGLSEGAVKSRLHRARLRLLAQLRTAEPDLGGAHD